MLGYSPLGAVAVGENYSENKAPAPVDTIDASKVPPERRVVFEGAKRVVSFPGSIHKVKF